MKQAITLYKVRTAKYGENILCGETTDDGNGISFSGTGRKLRWILRSCGGDHWTIRVHLRSCPDTFIMKNGFVLNKKDVGKLVSAGRSAMAAYRRDE